MAVILVTPNDCFLSLHSRLKTSSKFNTCVNPIDVKIESKDINLFP